MSLKINLNFKKVVKWVAIAALGVFLLVFFIRVAIFENNYYQEKEGSEREIVEIEEEEVLDETTPTEEEVIEYTVAADRPRYLSIAKLGVVNSRVLAMGVKANGKMATPNNIFDVGWYESSGKPGQGGTLVIDGHNGGPNIRGVFKDLPKLVEGDVIKIERGDGSVFRYEVVENVAIPIDEANNYMKTAFKSPIKGKESVTLISCSGEWVIRPDRNTYSMRQFVRAILVD